MWESGSSILPVATQSFYGKIPEEPLRSKQMEQNRVQHISLLVDYSLILLPVVRWGVRNAKKEIRNGVPPLTLHHAFTKGLVFALWCGSGSGILAVFLGMKFDHPIGRAIWGPIQVGILCLIIGFIVFPLVQLLSERLGTI